jgi:hypothetical protein
MMITARQVKLTVPEGIMNVVVGVLAVTVLTGKTPDSAVMTTRAGKYH